MDCIAASTLKGVQNFHRDGFSILTAVFEPQETEALIEALSQIDAHDGVHSRGGVYAVRNLLSLSPAIDELAHSARLRTLAEAHLGSTAFPVRGTLFDKTPGANWIVPWHQDLTICVAGRRDVAGYGPWTRKAGVCHVQPPVGILEQMLAVRIHLDRCEESNGALRVLPGTHRLGRLTAPQIAEQRSVAPVCCAAEEGDLLLMRPLLVHASSAASATQHRRVIHIDYASCPLHDGLEWSTAVKDKAK